jgi:hypothetical protein
MLSCVSAGRHDAPWNLAVKPRRQGKSPGLPGRVCRPFDSAGRQVAAGTTLMTAGALLAPRRTDTLRATFLTPINVIAAQERWPKAPCKH